MRVRIKFSKHGVVKFIGHLDMMRFFQKAIRRAGIDVAYSGGFSPHQQMSFASPLGVGLYSNGEYFDLEIHSHNGKEDMMKRLNDACVFGIRVENIVLLPEGAKNGMASVAAAAYTIRWVKEDKKIKNLSQIITSFYEQEAIMVTKETKKNTVSMDIKPGIFELSSSNDDLYMLVDASSSQNIKPTLLLEALYHYCDLTFDPMDIQITREETYTTKTVDGKDELCPLDHVGVDF